MISWSLGIWGVHPGEELASPPGPTKEGSPTQPPWHTPFLQDVPPRPHSAGWRGQDQALARPSSVIPRQSTCVGTIPFWRNLLFSISASFSACISEVFPSKHHPQILSPFQIYQTKRDTGSPWQMPISVNDLLPYMDSPTQDNPEETLSCLLTTPQTNRNPASFLATLGSIYLIMDPLSNLYIRPSIGACRTRM